MKDIFVAGKENIAVRMNKDGVTVLTEANDTVEALLLSVKACLEKVKLNDDNSEEPTMIFLPGYIKGLAGGSVMQYIRTKKTGGDKEISDRNIELYREVMTMYGERNLNVAFRDAQYFGKSEDEVALKKLNDKAWEAVKTEAKKRALNGGSKTSAPAEPAVDPKIMNKIKELKEQYLDAVLECDEELEAKLEKQIAKLEKMFLVKADTKKETPAVSPETTVTKEDNGDVDWDSIEEEA